MVSQPGQSVKINQAFKLERERLNKIAAYQEGEGVCDTLSAMMFSSRPCIRWSVNGSQSFNSAPSLVSVIDTILWVIGDPRHHPRARGVF